MPWAKVKPVVDLKVRALCAHKYPNHPHGCPNFNKAKRPDCPPQCPTITDTININKTVYVIYNKFPFGNHVVKMKAKHPNWTDRQLANCLYWQGTARKQLKDEIKLFLSCHNGFYVVKNPEAQGVNLTATMAKIGIELEWPPKVDTYQIVLAGRRI
jgi:predicted metal-binding protein